MAEIPANTPQDWGMRGATNTTLPQFKGKPRQLIINVDDGYRPVIMDGNTLGGKFKCASIEELANVSQIATNALTQEKADVRYLGIHAKADSAKMADEAMHASSADTATHADTASNADEALRANEATKATQDKNGKDISLTYATKQELGTKLGKTEKAASATVADRANSVAWTNVSDKPAATENVKGILQLANASDISTGTDTTKAVTPKQLKDGLNEKLGRNEKASSASVADRATVANSADSVQWNNVQGRPTISPSPNAYVTQTWHSGDNWYRVWSDGWIEQGGCSYTTNSYQKPISFHKPFHNTNYCMVASAENDTKGDIYGVVINTRATTNANIFIGANFGYYCRARWYACGS